MIHLTSVAYLFLAAGILTSVSLIGVHQILLAVPAVYYLLKFIKGKKFAISLSTQLLCLFLIWAFLSLILNYEFLDNPGKSFGKLKFIFFALSGIIVLSNWLPTVKRTHLNFIINTFFLSVVCAGFVAIYQFVSSGGGRSEGLIGIMKYGYASALISILILGLLLQRKKIKFEFNLYFALAALIFGLAGVYLTQTRGAFAGFMSAVPFVLYFYRPKIGIAFGVLSTVLISVIAYAYLYGSSTSGSRYLKSRNDMGDVVRREQWQSAVIAVKEHPVLGWGFNNFYSQVERIKKENNLKTTFYINEHSHNTFLEVAAGTGLVGAAFFILWLCFWALESFKLESPLRGIFVPFGVCMVVSGQFEVLLDSNNSALLFFVYSLSQFAVSMQKNKVTV